MGNGPGQFFAISMYAFNTGEVSLKASSGAGLVGLGESKELAGIPEKIVALSQTLVPLTRPANSSTYAAANRVCFHFLTTSGLKVYECGMNELRPGHAFQEVFGLFSRIKYVADKFMDEINKKKNNPH